MITPEELKAMRELKNSEYDGEVHLTNAQLDSLIDEIELLKKEREEQLKGADAFNEWQNALEAETAALREAAEPFADERYCNGFPDCPQHKLKAALARPGPGAAFLEALKRERESHETWRHRATVAEAELEALREAARTVTRHPLIASCVAKPKLGHEPGSLWLPFKLLHELAEHGLINESTASAAPESSP